jgi:hypothetical protein
MSHVSRIELQIDSLDCLQRACAFLGLTFVKNQKTYKWYGRLVSPDSTALPEGITEEDLGTCNHAIQVPEAEYEIGVVKRNGMYLLLCDFWDSRLKQRIGENGGRLKQAYAMERTKLEARRKRYTVREQKIDNGIRLVLSA